MKRLFSNRVTVFLLVLCLGIGVRLIHLIFTGADVETRTGEIVRTAKSLARVGVYGNTFGDDTGVSAHIAPLYAWVLGGIYRFFGCDTYAARMVQSLLCILVVSLTFALLPELSRRLGLSPGAGIVTALLLAVVPLNGCLETSGCWEQPHAAAVLVGLLWLFAALHDDGWQSWRLIVMGGVLLGIASLLSPVLLPAVGLILVAEFVSARHFRPRMVLGSTAMLAVCAVLVTPWAVRNYLVLGGFVPTRSNLGLELWIGNNPYADGKTNPTLVSAEQKAFFASIHPMGSPKERARLREIGELSYMREKQELAVAWIVAHPWEFARLTAMRLRLHWMPTPAMCSENGLVGLVKAGLLTGTGLLALAGLARFLLVRDPYRWLWVAIVVGPSLAHVVTHVDVRYRYPIFALSMLVSVDLVFRLARAVAAHWTVERRNPEVVARSAARSAYVAGSVSVASAISSRRPLN
jgi:hypothetical protein